MRFKSITKASTILIGYSLLITGLNVVLLGTTTRLFFPTANYLAVAFIWLYRGFDSVLALGLGIFIISILLLTFVKLIIHKKAFWGMVGIYMLDLVATIYLLVNSLDLLYSLSLIIDIAAVSIVFVWIKQKKGNDFPVSFQADEIGPN